MSENAAPPPPPPPPPAGGPPPPAAAAGGAAAGQQNGMGIAALVLGLAGILCCQSVIVPILAIIFGVIGRKKAAQGLASNGGMATAGLVLGIITLIVGVVVWILAIANGNWTWYYNN